MNYLSFTPYRERFSSIQFLSSPFYGRAFYPVPPERVPSRVVLAKRV
jgi:hypothetical protein